MIEQFRDTYIRKSVLFKELPDDLQTAIIQKLIWGVALGIVILALGICSKNLTTFLLSLVFLGTTAVICTIPYYLATRNLILQISGICIDKDIHRFVNNKSYRIYLESMPNQVRVSVKRSAYNNIRHDMAINVYVIPKNIQQDTNGLYMIETPIFVTFRNQ